MPISRSCPRSAEHRPRGPSGPGSARQPRRQPRSCRRTRASTCGDRLVDGLRRRVRQPGEVARRGDRRGAQAARLLDRARHQAADQRDHQQQVDRGEPGRGEDVEELQPVEQRGERRVVGEVLGDQALVQRALRQQRTRQRGEGEQEQQHQRGAHAGEPAPGVAQQRPRRRAAGRSRPAARRGARWWSSVSTGVKPATDTCSRASSPPHSPLTSSSPTATSRTPPPIWIARVCRRSQPSARTAREAPSAISDERQAEPGAVGEGEHDPAQRAATGARGDGDDARERRPDARHPARARTPRRAAARPTARRAAPSARGARAAAPGRARRTPAPSRSSRRRRRAAAPARCAPARRPATRRRRGSRRTRR